MKRDNEANRTRKQESLQKGLAGVKALMEEARLKKLAERTQTPAVPVAPSVVPENLSEVANKVNALEDMTPLEKSEVNLRALQKEAVTKKAADRAEAKKAKVPRHPKTNKKEKGQGKKKKGKKGDDWDDGFE